VEDTSVVAGVTGGSSLPSGSFGEKYKPLGGPNSEGFFFASLDQVRIKGLISRFSFEERSPSGRF
jgi:hypothetical protein